MEVLRFVPPPTQVAGKPSVVGLPSQARAEFFGSGVLDSLREEVGSHADLTAVFISTYRLRSSQRTALEEAFGGLPVIDRYGLVLQIFQRHAQTKEARRVLKVLFLQRTSLDSCRIMTLKKVLDDCLANFSI